VSIQVGAMALELPEDPDRRGASGSHRRSGAWAPVSNSAFCFNAVPRSWPLAAPSV